MQSTIDTRPYKTIRKRAQPTLKDPERTCVVCGKSYIAVAPLQKTCSKECRVIHYKPRQLAFKEANPEAWKKYAANRVKADPMVWRNKRLRDRTVSINALGGKCCVEHCEVTNPNWLHIDYIPTMHGTGYRHPRHKRWILDHLQDFRLLCANHHYELTITGKIEGTSIFQPTKHRPKLYDY